MQYKTVTYKLLPSLHPVLTDEVDILLSALADYGVQNAS
jgi:hypothetical protein